ncbi:histidine kinase [Dokdonia sp.]|uniref:sensor histidine kinase n=1 Tax=Dokdonia sp. TaxID=2024995 RepID=UPI0032670462
MSIQSQNKIDKTLLKYVLLFFGVAFLISGFGSFIGKGIGVAYASYSWGGLFINLVMRYVSKFIFILLGIYIVQYLYTKGIKNWIGLAIHALFAIGLTFYSIYSQMLISNWFLGTDDIITWNYIYTRAILGTDYNFFLYFSVIAIVYAYNFFKKQKDYKIQESILKAQLSDVKMSVLQSQLQPHFLFNALNDISSLVDIHPEHAQDVIADLSDMLRQTLHLKNTKFITIQQETALLKKYLTLEKIRYQEKLEFDIQFSENIATCMVPPLLIQPIVENAIKHGYSYAHDFLKINVVIKKEKKMLCIEITNNGASLDTSSITYGTGLTNTLARLETLYQEDFSFEFVNKKPKGIFTSIKIPILEK